MLETLTILLTIQDGVFCWLCWIGVTYSKTNKIRQSAGNYLIFLYLRNYLWNSFIFWRYSSQ